MDKKKAKKKNSKEEKKRKHEEKLAAAARWRVRKKAGKIGTPAISVNRKSKSTRGSKVGAACSDENLVKLFTAGFGKKATQGIVATQEANSSLGLTLVEAALLHLEAGKLG